MSVNYVDEKKIGGIRWPLLFRHMVYILNFTVLNNNLCKLDTESFYFCRAILLIQPGQQQ